MDQPSDIYQRGAAAAMDKYAARRALKEIRSAVGAGDMARANRIATTPGALSEGAGRFGSQIKDLVSAKNIGGEGLPTLVAHPQHGVAVRKLYDPAGGAFSAEMVKRKEQLANMPGAAKLLGTGVSQQGTPMHFNEFVQGREVTRAMRAADPKLDQAYGVSLRAAKRYAGQQGFKLRDMREANAIATPEGKVKFVDNLPYKPSEVESLSNPLVRQIRAKHPNMVITTDAANGLRQPIPGYQGAPAKQNLAGFKQRMLGQPAAPVAPQMSTVAPQPQPPAAAPTKVDSLRGVDQVLAGKPPPAAATNVERLRA